MYISFKYYQYWSHVNCSKHGHVFKDLFFKPHITQGKLKTVNVKDSLGTLEFLRHNANTCLSH